MRANLLTRRIRSGGMPLMILLVLLAILCLGGGASRATAFGQVLVRTASFLSLAALLLSRARFDLNSIRAPLLILVASALLVAVQSIPLPYAAWTSLPHRDLIAGITSAAGLGETWRPAAIVPDGALNALFSLVVPFAVLLGMAAVPTARGRGFFPVLIAIVCLSALCGMFQLSGGNLDNPFLNDRRGQAAGLFPNRNHQALFLAIGVPLALAWGFAPHRRPGWRGWAATGIVLLLTLTIIGTGSRAGLGLLAVGMVGGGLLIWPMLVKLARRAPRWAMPASVLVVLLFVGALLILSVDVGRAEAIDRLLEEEVGTDMRTRALSTLGAMITGYLPWGSGLGSFDAVFRMVEPFELLKPTYFNHAHNDYIELLIEAGLPGAVLLIIAVGWFCMMSWRAWRGGDAGNMHVARTGSVMILLILLASMADYPARTPLIMTMLAIGAGWMCSASRNVFGSTDNLDAEERLIPLR